LTEIGSGPGNADSAAPGENGHEEHAKEEEGTGAPKYPWPELWKSAGEKLVTLFISAGSLLGFVAFAGSIVLWSRFFAIHVPPDQVVAAVPQGESVAVGAVMLLLFGFFGALATLAVYLIDRGGRATPGMSRALLVILTVEAAVAIWIAGDSSVLVKVVASEILAITFAMALCSTFVGGLIELEPDKLRDLKGTTERGRDPVETAFWRPQNKPGVDPFTVAGVIGIAVLLGAIAFGAMRLFGSSAVWGWIIALAVGGAALLLAIALHLWCFKQRKANEKRDAERCRREARQQERKEAESLRGRLRAAWKACRSSRCDECHRRPCACPAKSEEEQQADEEDDALSKPPLFELTIWGAAVIVALALIAVVVPSLILREWWLGVSLAIVFVIGAGLWRIAGLRRERFIFLGMAVFISVPLFGALMLMVRNLAEPQVQAVALIRSSDGPDEAIQGLYVTETSDRVYFANVATEGCSDKVKPASGRLLWVPKEEVVTMSIGPLEDVEDAGKTALEMAYALTPAVETPAGDRVSKTRPEADSQDATGDEARTSKAEGGTEKARARSKKAAKVEVEADAKGATKPPGRLEDPGPAVRPNFGSGLSLYPETASPGERVELRLSVPNESVEGFGPKPDGRTLRLDGVPVSLVREGTRDAREAEFVKTLTGVKLSLDKKGLYRFREGEPEPLPEGERGFSGATYVKLEDSNVLGFKGGHADPYPEYFEVAPNGAHLAGEPEVSLEEGQFVQLDGRFRRQAWSNDKIAFVVPANGATGVVTVDCGQLAGQPFLRVSHTPTARIAVRMSQNTPKVAFDGGQSRDQDEEEISRSWTIGGVHRGHRERIATRLPMRRAPYTVELTVTDEAGNSDTARLLLLRLPTRLFAVKKKRPLHGKNIETAQAVLGRAVATEPPAAIELDAHTDDGGTAAHNLALSLKRDEHVRSVLLEESEKEPSEESVALQEVGYGETCPIDPRAGERPGNRRVEVFVLGDGVIVKPGKGCLPGRFKRDIWRPPLAP
jgi:flagellar motor protein MotB